MPRKPPPIEEIIEKEWLVKFDRKPMSKDMLYGFILAGNNEFLLLNFFDDNSFNLNGYTVIRHKDIKRFSVYNSEEYFLSKFIELKKIKPKFLSDFSIKNWKDILISAGRQFPLITIHLEKISDKVCYVGSLAATKKKGFSFNEIDSEATWTETFKYKYKDLTKIDFGGIYENALFLVAEQKSK